MCAGGVRPCAGQRVGAREGAVGLGGGAAGNSARRIFRTE
ncbi:hypothetical protein STTU_2847 [Streptomyces sp. Tu6071]|nr:hypothetical protein STTU_2847 [Streptomyces sp. Tu6071]